MLKIGWIDFLNTLPFDFILTGKQLDFEYKLVKSYPQDLNKKLFTGEIDIGIVSSAEYLENFDKYLILPNLSISAKNKVHSVAIFSNILLEDVDKIYLSSLSKSSKYLTKIVFELFLKKKVKYEILSDYSNLSDKTVLLIGDNAIKYSKYFRYTYDLSEIWYKNTKLPFVFALWVVRKDKVSTDIYKFFDVLISSKNVFFQNIECFINKKNINFDKKFAKFYLENIDYSLSDTHIKSLKLFGKFLKNLNIIKTLPEIRFLSALKHNNL